MAREASDFLNMNVEQLYNDYISFVLSDPKSKTVINELKKSERYSGDAQFRATIDFSAILKDAVTQDYKKLDFSKRIMKCIDIIERTTALELWQIAANSWNILALTYANLVMDERALECFSHALRIEKEHNICNLSPIIYTNMSDIYMNIREFDKALGFIEKGAELLETHKDSVTRYWDKYVGIYTRYLFLRIRKGQYEKESIKPYYDMIMAVPESEINFNTNRSKLAARFYYGFFYFEKKEMEAVFKEVRDLFGAPQTITFIQECIDMAASAGKDTEPYIQKLIELEKEGITHLNYHNMIS